MGALAPPNRLSMWQDVEVLFTPLIYRRPPGRESSKLGILGVRRRVL